MYWLDNLYTEFVCNTICVLKCWKEELMGRGNVEEQESVKDWSKRRLAECLRLARDGQ